jgi:hypothetical protein
MQTIIARQTLELDAVREVFVKTGGPSQRREAVKAFQERGLSQRRACALAGCAPRRNIARADVTTSDWRSVWMSSRKNVRGGVGGG